MRSLRAVLMPWPEARHSTCDSLAFRAEFVQRPRLA